MADIDINVENYKELGGLKKKLFQIFKAITAKLKELEVAISNAGTGGGPANLDDKIPVGSIQPFAGEKTNVPNRWLLCDGTAISRSTYPQLFSIVGETYGAGDGSTTFNLPDLRGEFIRGFDDGRGIDSGRTFGSNQLDEFKAHTHVREKYGLVSASGSGRLAPQSTGTDRITESTGGSETRPRNVALNYIIRVDVDTSPAPVAYEVPDGSITTAKLADLAVNSTKLNGDQILIFKNLTTLNPIPTVETLITGSTTSLILEGPTKILIGWGCTKQTNVPMLSRLRMKLKNSGGTVLAELPIETRQNSTGEQRYAAHKEFLTVLTAGTYTVELTGQASVAMASVVVDPYLKIVKLGSI